MEKIYELSLEAADVEADCDKKFEKWTRKREKRIGGILNIK
jgi:hypothetical protein